MFLGVDELIVGGSHDEAYSSEMSVRIRALIVVWALSPWLVWAVYQFHKPDHADAFWTASIPFVIFSCLPLVLSQASWDGTNWFPTGMVAVCSIFNVAAGILILAVVKALRKHR